MSLAELSGDALTTTAHPEDFEETDHGGFQLRLKNFEGPFDLLLSLIARKRLEVTEVALAEVTDEFLAYVRTIESTVDALDETSSFMVVAATLLDLKTARLLPAGISIQTKNWRYWKNEICCLPVCCSTKPSNRLLR